MKIPFTIYDLRFTIWEKSAGGTGVAPVVSGVAPETRPQGEAVVRLVSPDRALPSQIRRDTGFDRRDACSTRLVSNPPCSRTVAAGRQSSIIHHQFRRGFTMVEIAISLAIIGFALVTIIEVLPLGMQIQRDNREQTVINQDATVFMEAIRGGARGLDDLTNYVFMITNTYAGAPGQPRFFNSFPGGGAEIIGLLGTPEFVGNYSNRMVAFVYSMSGPAVEKPPQSSGSLIRQSSFSYGLICENLPVGIYTPPVWQAQAYNAGSSVIYILNGQTTYSYWQATANTSATDIPGQSALWARNAYTQELAANLHELRLTFLWPLLPDSLPPRIHYGTGHQTYRTLIAGRQVLDTNTVPSLDLYFFQSQSFTNAP